MKKLLSMLLLFLIVTTGLTCKDRTSDPSTIQTGGEQNLVNENQPTEKTKDEDSEKKVEEDPLIIKATEAFENLNFDEAIEFYTKALPSSTNPAKLHYNIGLCYGHKGMLDGAISEFKKAIAIDPNHINALNNLGLAFERKGLLDQALAEYKQAVTINPDYAQAHYNIGRIYFLRGLQNPDSRSLAADHYYRAGTLFLEQGDEGRALMTYKGLQQTKSKESEQALYNKFSPELQQRVDNPEK